MKSLSSQLLLTEQSPWPCGVAGALSGLLTTSETLLVMVREEAARTRRRGREPASSVWLPSLKAFHR